MAVTFESMERRMPKIEKCLAENGIGSLEEARQLCLDNGFDPDEIVKGVQPIAFENASWGTLIQWKILTSVGHPCFAQQRRTTLA